PGVYEYKLESVDIRGGTEEFARLAGPVVGDEMAVAGGEELDAASIAGANLMRPIRPIGPMGPTGRMRGTQNASARSNARVTQNGRGGPSYNGSAALRWFSGSATHASSFTAAKVVYSAPGVILIPQ